MVYNLVSLPTKDNKIMEYTNSLSKDKIIDKVKKLLAVADPKSNTFEAEMENAMRLAKNLMAKYQIEMYEVEAAGGAREVMYEFESKDAYAGSMAGWELYLAPTVDNLCCTKSFRRRQGSRSTIVFCGAKSDCAVAKEMYSILNNVIRERARNYSNPSVNHTAYRSYAEGVVHSLHERSLEEIDLDNNEDHNKYALIVVNKKTKVEQWMEDTFHTKQSRARSRRVDHQAYFKGREEGNYISLKTRGLIK